VISVANALTNQMDEDFVGVKVGDVNNTAIPNFTTHLEDRTGGTAIFDIKDRHVEAGEEFDVVFKAAHPLSAYQFTLLLDGLVAIGTVDAENVTSNNFNLTIENAVAVSIDGAQEFTMRFRAKSAGQLSRMLILSNYITRTEAYDAKENGMAKLDVVLRFDGSQIVGIGFELYQNQPNPFVDRTVVGFNLPEAAQATLTIYDENGRLIFTQKDTFAKGYNAFLINNRLIEGQGLLWYRVEAGHNSATGTMIQMK
jgi:hypothetical protein